jgi:hypothetical protein
MESDHRSGSSAPATALATLETASQLRPTIPRDVRVFIANADRCEHLAGEWDSGLTVARQEEIERGVTRYCGLAQMQLKALSEKYKGDAATQALVTAHAYESVLSFKK